MKSSIIFFVLLTQLILQEVKAMGQNPHIKVSALNSKLTIPYDSGDTITYENINDEVTPTDKIRNKKIGEYRPNTQQHNEWLKHLRWFNIKNIPKEQHSMVAAYGKGNTDTDIDARYPYFGIKKNATLKEIDHAISMYKDLGSHVAAREAAARAAQQNMTGYKESPAEVSSQNPHGVLYTYIYDSPIFAKEHLRKKAATKEIGQLSNVDYLNLHNSKLSGPIPALQILKENKAVKDDSDSDIDAMYRYFGITENATLKEIEDAYKRLSKLYKSNGGESTPMFQELENKYTALRSHVAAKEAAAQQNITDHKESPGKYILNIIQAISQDIYPQNVKPLEPLYDSQIFAKEHFTEEGPKTRLGKKAAATKLQAIVRGRRGRAEAKSLLNEKTARTNLQNIHEIEYNTIIKHLLKQNILATDSFKYANDIIKVEQKPAQNVFGYWIHDGEPNNHYVFEGFIHCILGTLLGQEANLKTETLTNSMLVPKDTIIKNDAALVMIYVSTHGCKSGALVCASRPAGECAAFEPEKFIARILKKFTDETKFIIVAGSCYGSLIVDYVETMPKAQKDKIAIVGSIGTQPKGYLATVITEVAFQNNSHISMNTFLREVQAINLKDIHMEKEDSKKQKLKMSYKFAAFNTYDDIINSKKMNEETCSEYDWDDINKKGDEEITPLGSAVFYGKQNMMKLLLNNDADVNSKDVKGIAPLYTAIARSSEIENPVEVVKILLEYNADVNIQDINGWTPLLVAAYIGNIELVELLLDNNADVNIPNIDGWTPLLIAANIGNIELVELLLDNNADVNIPEKNGLTPLQVAKSNNNVELIKLLDPHHDYNPHAKGIIRDIRANDEKLKWNSIFKVFKSKPFDINFGEETGI